MTVQPNTVPRRLEITLHALLGHTVRVEWGPTLASDGETVWVPPERSPFGVHLVRALQAHAVATAPITAKGGHELSGWEEVLANLYAEARLRERFPGLAIAYDAFSRPTLGQAGNVEIGDLFLDLMLSSGIPRRRIPRRLAAAYQLWNSKWEAWLRMPSRRVPVPPVPSPTRKLPYQAARRSLRAAVDEVEPTYPGGPPGVDQRGIVIAVGVDGRRIVLPLPTAPGGGGLPSEGSAGASGPLVTAPGFDEPASAHAEPTAWYDEWDAERRRYLSHWCAVFDRPVSDVAHPPGGDSRATPSAIRRVRQAFEQYRAANRWSRREPEGAEVDVEAAVEASADAGRRGFATEALFMSRRVRQSEAAVAVLIDLSDSVSGMTLDIEKQALLLVAAALEGVGDDFALYGFCGRSRLRCELLRIKDFGQPYQQSVTSRIGALRPSGYTRIAPAVRHMTARLASTAQRHKILLLVTDGMPYDVEGYGGQYAVEDTRRAWIEARTRGIRPYCLNIDFAANQYLPRMCGPASWTVVSETRRLPDALVALYQRVRT